LLQELRGFSHAELLRPGDEGPVTRDLVVFDGLRAGQDAGIMRVRLLELLHDLLSLLDQSEDGGAGLAARWLLDQLEHLLEFFSAK
jgi:hypothetical protein